MPDLDLIQIAIDRAQAFAVKTGHFETGEGALDAERISACIHLLDHAERLGERARDSKRAEDIKKNADVSGDALELASLVQNLAGELTDDSNERGATAQIAGVAVDLEEDKKHFRREMIQFAAIGEGIPGDELDHLLDAHRWLRRMTYHSWKIGHYADQTQPETRGNSSDSRVKSDGSSTQ